MSKVETYLADSGMAPSALGDAALGDKHFVKQLRKGRRCWPETQERVLDFMRQNPPADEQERLKEAS